MTSDQRKVLVTGADGMLGSQVCLQLVRSNCNFVGTVLENAVDGQETLDICDAQAVEYLLDQVRPTHVVNCAAYTNVDGAEQEEALATRINGDAPGFLAQACVGIGAHLAHISTDYVFKGVNDRPWRPDDPVDPVNAYGRSKLAGEQAILASDAEAVIVRTSWLFGPNGSNFVDTIARLALEKDELKVVNDQIGCPTYTVDLASALIRLGQCRYTGIGHFCNPPACSWYDFAGKIVDLNGANCSINPCGSEDFPRPAARPAYSVLDCSDLFAALGGAPRCWEDALRDYLGQTSPVQ